MALLVSSKPLAASITNLTPNILDINAGPHALTFVDFKQVLNIENNEAVPITVNVLGDGVVAYNCPKYGTINVSAGLDVVVPAGETHTLYTSTIAAYLGAAGNNVTLTFTGSTAPALAFVWLNEY